MSVRPGAAIIAVGNELLSGKVADQNTPFLTKELRDLGMPLLEARWIPDDLGVIAATFREVAAAYEVVFSSGGVGPTHDDVTLAGIARAFDVPLVRHAELAHEIAKFYGDKTNEALLHMADLPEGALLVRDRGLALSVVQVRNVYVLPGVPRFFQLKFDAIKERFRRTPFHLRRLYTNLDEGDIAGHLEEAERRFEISVGSYPRYDGAEYSVLVTLESKAAARVEEALAFLRERIPPAHVVRVE